MEFHVASTFGVRPVFALGNSRYGTGTQTTCATRGRGHEECLSKAFSFGEEQFSYWEEPFSFTEQPFPNLEIGQALQILERMNPFGLDQADPWLAKSFYHDHQGASLTPGKIWSCSTV